ncbi:hypothetical protein OROHE_005921 [Orobanche hederae]
MNRRFEKPAVLNRRTPLPRAWQEENAKKARQAEKESAKNGGSSSSKNFTYLPADEWFAKLTEDVLDKPNGIPMDGIMRNMIRMTAEIRTREYGALESLVGKTLVWLQVFVFLAGDFAMGEGGLDSREAVMKLLHELYTPEGMRKIHGFDVVAGSAKVAPENLAALKGGTHVSLS